MIEQRDLVLVTIPFTDTPVPLYAIAQLKSVALEAGWSCRTIDLNNQFIKQIYQHRYSTDLVDWFYHETYHPGIEQFLSDMFDSMAKQILASNPKIVGISLFTYACQIATKYLCIHLRKRAPNVKIILGGSGVYDNVLGESEYIDAMKYMKLVDHHFVGDAEISFYDFLKGEKNIKGLDKPEWEEITNAQLAEIPYANFEDYDWSIYRKPIIPMTASRGCVRRCKFCSDIAHWKLFSFRTGQHIFDEMMYQKKKYGISRFHFTDALINGNVKEFRVLCGLLSEYNTANPDDKISWVSQFIFRPRRQFAEEDWRLLAGSNPLELHVGVESLDPTVRHDMGKKFDQDDMEFNLEQALKYNIQIHCMMIVGYPTEDEASIEVAKDWLRTRTRFHDIISLSWGGTMAILPGTYLDKNQEDYEIEVYGPPWQLWRSPVSTVEKRVRWWNELSDLSKELGYRTSVGIENNAVIDILSSMDHQKPVQAYSNDRALDPQTIKLVEDVL
jgi:hypothetical protein